MDNSGSSSENRSGNGARNCARCSWENPESAAFCFNCGARLGTPSSSLRQTHAGLPTPSQQSVGASRQTTASEAWGRLVVVEEDGNEGTAFPLTKSLVTLGRGPADISIPSDPMLAKEHLSIARTAKDGGTVSIVPIDTTNGVFIRISGATEIRSADVVLCGQQVIRFDALDNEAPEAKSTRDVLLFASPSRPAWGVLSQMTSNGQTRDVRYLTQDQVTVGREQGDIVYREDLFLSRMHAVIQRHNEVFYVNDLGSSNGTFLRIKEPMVVSTKQQIRVGDHMFRVEIL